MSDKLLRGSATGMIAFGKVRSSHGTFYETIYTGSVEEWEPAIDATGTLPIALIPIEQMDTIAATLRSRGEWVYIDPTDRWRP